MEESNFIKKYDVFHIAMLNVKMSLGAMEFILHNKTRSLQGTPVNSVEYSDYKIVICARKLKCVLFS